MAFGDVWYGKFIIDHGNWLSTGEDHMWSGTSAENNPCPSGFRIPTNAEWVQEMRTWTSPDEAGAYASPLKLPKGGYRWLSNGSIHETGTVGRYWSSTTYDATSRALYFDNTFSGLYNEARGYGYCVRCIKD
jgi:uncharacterized protein (TIGR02145 family)